MEYLQYSQINLLLAINIYILVLNLVISGIPSIHILLNGQRVPLKSFKPCYKWNTFNTSNIKYMEDDQYEF